MNSLLKKYDIEQHRKFIASLEKKEKRKPAKKIKAKSFLLLSKNNSRLIAFIYRPSFLAANTTYPTILHIRGTGFNTSALYYSYITCTHLAEKAHCQVIDINHRFAPEFPCPTGFNDVYSNIKHIIKNAKLLQINLTNLAILGYSSGGNFAALAAIKAKEDKLPISLQILISPITDLSRSLNSHIDFENQDIFPSSLAQWFLKLYLQENNDPKSSAISPYWSIDLRNLPPTYFLFGEFDRFRSDSELYEKKLSEADVWTHKLIFAKAKHSFYWSDLEAIKKTATLIKLGFNLFTIPRPIQRIKERQEESSKQAVTFRSALQT